jgi:hypothetical protein
VGEHAGCPRPMVTVIEEPPDVQLRRPEFKKAPDGGRP